LILKFTGFGHQRPFVNIGCGISYLLPNYTGNTSIYLEPIMLRGVSPNGTSPSPDQCVDTQWTPGSIVAADFYLENYDETSKSNHTVDAASIAPPFTLLGIVAPSLPAPIAWNGTVNLVLSLRVPQVSAPETLGIQGTVTIS
jgi:hypothetical protein